MGFVVTATTGIRFVYIKKKMEMNVSSICPCVPKRAAAGSPVRPRGIDPSPRLGRGGGGRGERRGDGACGGEHLWRMDDVGWEATHPFWKCSA